MAKKQDERVVPLSSPLTPVQHFQLKYLSKFHNRSMNDELVNLIEEEANSIHLEIDWDDAELRKYAEKAAANLGMSEADYIEKEKKNYARKQGTNNIVGILNRTDIPYELRVNLVQGLLLEQQKQDEKTNEKTA